MENGCFRWWMGGKQKMFTLIVFLLVFTFYWLRILSSVLWRSTFFPSFLCTHTHTLIILYCSCDLFSHTRARDFSIFMRQCAQCTTYLKSYIHLCIQFFSMRQIKHPISHTICNFFPSFLLLLLVLLLLLLLSKLHLWCAKCV